MSDEGFHEIQLNGKQLVFLFMAATVVSVVIFLLGVMVGRGVPSTRAQAAEITDDTLVDPTEDVQVPAAPSSDRMPVSAQESLTYAQRLSAPTPSQDPVKDIPVPPAAPPSPAVPEAVPPAPVNERVTAPVAPPAATTRTSSAPAAPVREQAAAVQKPQPATGFAEPAGDGHVVQVGAYPQATAETIARRLASKGYPVFIAPRPQGLFAVRVGKYGDRREAETVAGRLAQQEQFNKPWVTR